MKQGCPVRVMAMAGVAASALFATSVMAQEAPGDTPANAKQDNGFDDNVIVVTANKREQSLDEVGLAISALGGEALANKALTSQEDLAAVVPGMSFTPTQLKAPVITLRGVGFYETSLASYPAVTSYLDQVPLTFPVTAAHAGFDVQRVEVLKGPQGTLFGQNSTGGAINYVANKPTDFLEAGVSLSYGRFDEFHGSAYISGPLAEGINARLSVDSEYSSDWQRSTSRPDDTLGSKDYLAGRLQLQFVPSDRFEALLSVNAWQDKSDPQAAQLHAINPVFPGLQNPFLNTVPLTPFKARLADWTPTASGDVFPPAREPFADAWMVLPSLSVRWEIVDGITMNSISAYTKYKQHNGYDNDAIPLRIVEFNRVDGDIESFFQEVRISNDANSTLRWTLGATYEKSSVTENSDDWFINSSTTPTFGYSGSTQISDQDMDTWAIFGNVEFEIADNLNLRGGMRYTKSKRDSHVSVVDPGDGTFEAVFQGLADAIQLGFIPIAGFTPPGVPAPPINGGPTTIDNVTFDGTPATYLPSAINVRLNEDNVSWRVGLDYVLDDGTLLYANVAKGYKAGSIPVASAATIQQFAPVTQESVLSYEAGVKYKTPDRRIALQLAGFYYDYSDKQLRAKLADPIFGPLDFLQNVPSSRIWGVEADATIYPTDGLTFTASFAYLDGKIQDFQGLNSIGDPVDFSGSRMPYVPKIQLNVTGDYEWDVGEVRAFIGSDVRLRSSTVTQIGGAASIVPLPGFRSSVPTEKIFDIPSYVTVDARAGVRFNDERIEISVYGRNIFDKYYITNIFPVYDTYVRYAGRPATYGVRVSFKY